VLFSEHRDYLQFATQLSPSLQSASGFWDGQNNTSVFYDHATTDDFRILQDMSDQLQGLKESAKKLKRNERPAYKVGERIIELKDLARMADTIELLVGIERENLDIEVVSHEATHQMAGNTGLFPRDVVVPSWVHWKKSNVSDSRNTKSSTNNCLRNPRLSDPNSLRISKGGS